MYFNSLRCHPLGLLLALVLGLPPLVLGFLLLKFSPGPDGLANQGGLGLVLWANYLFWGRPALLLGILLWRLQLRRNRADRLLLAFALALTGLTALLFRGPALLVPAALAGGFWALILGFWLPRPEGPAGALPLKLWRRRQFWAFLLLGPALAALLSWLHGPSYLPTAWFLPLGLVGLLVSRLPRQRPGPTLLATTRLGFAAPVAVGLLLQAGLRLWLLLMDIPAPSRVELALRPGIFRAAVGPGSLMGPGPPSCWAWLAQHAQLAAIEGLHLLENFRTAVHHEGALGGDGLVDGYAAQQQHLGLFPMGRQFHFFTGDAVAGGGGFGPTRWAGANS